MGKHREARAAKGDRQAGQITRTSKIVESGQDYKASVRGGVPYADGKADAGPDTSAAHHINGIADTDAITSTMSDQRLDNYRSTLATGGAYIGNQYLNYTPLFDGKLSMKGTAKRGIYSYDHYDVHRFVEQEQAKIGFDPKAQTFNNIPIADLPESVQDALGLQLDFINNLAIDKVQTQRYNTLKKAYPDESYQERQERILNNQPSFASLDPQNRPIPEDLRQYIPNDALERQSIFSEQGGSTSLNVNAIMTKANMPALGGFVHHSRGPSVTADQSTYTPPKLQPAKPYTEPIVPATPKVNMAPSVLENLGAVVDQAIPTVIGGAVVGIGLLGGGIKNVGGVI
jgi:hypothetical protein